MAPPKFSYAIVACRPERTRVRRLPHRWLLRTFWPFRGFCLNAGPWLLPKCWRPRVGQTRRSGGKVANRYVKWHVRFLGCRRQGDVGKSAAVIPHPSAHVWTASLGEGRWAHRFNRCWTKPCPHHRGTEMRGSQPYLPNRIRSKIVVSQPTPLQHKFRRAGRPLLFVD